MPKNYSLILTAAGFAVAMIGYTVGITWWASTVSSDVKNVTKDFNEFKADFKEYKNTSRNYVLSERIAKVETALEDVRRGLWNINRYRTLGSVNGPRNEPARAYLTPPSLTSRESIDKNPLADVPTTGSIEERLN